MNSSSTAHVDTFASPARDPRGDAKSVFAAAVGNFVEYFDWTIYALMAPYFASQIFHAEDRRVSLLLAFLTFALGYLSRPIGALLVGAFSDRFGRRSAMMVTIIAMASCSLVIGFAPTYASAGIYAAVILMLARFIQGVSAGGEVGSATTYLLELAPAGRRAFVSSFQQVSTGLSTLTAVTLAAALSGMLSAEQMTDWGWRVPFILGGLLGVAGLYVRRRALESPAFEHSSSHTPVLRSVGVQWRAVALSSGIMLFPSVTILTWQIYLPTYIAETTDLSQATAFAIMVIGIVIFVLLTPLFATLSDRIGRKPMMIGYCLASLLWVYPTYVGVPMLDSFAAVLAIAVIGNIILAVMGGSLVACVTEQFATRIRATGSGLSYAIASIVAAASFSPVVTVLMNRAQYESIVVYVGAIGVVSLCAYIVMPETKGIDIDAEARARPSMQVDNELIEQPQ